MTDKGYIDREFSWLEFNDRVLDQTRGKHHPLLERLKFLAISGSNLDEFFQVRVGSLKFLLSRSLADDGQRHPADGDALAALKARVRRFYDWQYRILLEELEPALAQHDIRRLDIADLNATQLDFLKRQFEEVISSVVSPIGVTGEDEFPLLAGAPLCICVELEKSSSLLAEPEVRSADANTLLNAPSAARFVVIPLGRSLNRFWKLPSASGFHYVLLETIVAAFVGSLFPEQVVKCCVTFRVTRNADLELDELGVSDLLEEIEQLLESRKVSDCVRLEIQQSAGSSVREFLRRSLRISESDIYECPGPIDLSAMMRLSQLQGHAELKDQPWPPQPSADFVSGSDIFEVISQQDRILLHPYQSFEPVVELVRQAAADPDVLAIKQTLYRTSRNSAIVTALAEAARAGKSVTAIVELKARFDEAPTSSGLANWRRPAST